MSERARELFGATFADGISCTMLEPARVAGRTWLVFIIESQDEAHDLSEIWLPGRRVKFFHDDVELFADDGGGGGDSLLWLDHHAFAEAAIEVRLLEVDGSVAATTRVDL